MRFSVLLATSALVLGVASSTNAAERPRPNKLTLFQDAGGMAVANIDMLKGDNTGFISQKGFETHLNLKAEGLWNDFGAVQEAKGAATVDANLYSWSGNSKLVFEVEAVNTSSIAAQVNGVQAVIAGTQAAGGDVTFIGGTGGHDTKFQVEQLSDEGSAYTTYSAVSDEGNIAALKQTAPGDTIADINLDYPYSPNWDPQAPFKDAAAVNE
jgi:hypothetical protein